jgi:L-Ala-D/L-Glu epimerase
LACHRFVTQAQAALFRLNGMRDSKLKVGGDASKDLRRAACLARAGKVRLDANNLWQDVNTATAALKALSRYAWAVEEPLAARDWRGLRELNISTGLAIVADESLVTSDDLGAMPPGEAFIPNLRVSKLGGLIRSADILRRALSQGRKIIVGAQVGETSILARAGLALVAAAGTGLVGYEGGYGPVLLAYDVATPQVRIGRHGTVYVKEFARRPGLGLVAEPVLSAALGL